MDFSLGMIAETLNHLENAYFIPHFHATAKVAKTNIAPTKPYRGAGIPQGIGMLCTVFLTIILLVFKLRESYWLIMLQENWAWLPTFLRKSTSLNQYVLKKKRERQRERE
jgi:hypothetical protein